MSSSSTASGMESAAGAFALHERARPAELDKVFVAVGEENGRSTLRWALQNLAKEGAMIVILHVHCPAQMIPVMGIEVHHTMMSPQVVDAHRKKERAKAEEKLDEYVLMCTGQKFRCQKLTIEKDEVAKGLEELIALHGITNLVMGAAADERYSNFLEAKLVQDSMQLDEDRKQIMQNMVYLQRISDMHQDLSEAQYFREMAYEELTKRRKAEQDLSSALQTIREWETLHQREISRRQSIEELRLKDREDVGEMKRQFEAVHDQLDGAKDRMAEMESAMKIQNEELTMSKHSIKMLEANNEKLRHELRRCVARLELTIKDHSEKFGMIAHRAGMLLADNERLQKELKRRMREMESAREAHEQELATSKCLIEVLQSDKEKLHQELEAALSEAQDSRGKSTLSSASEAPPSHFVCPISQEVMNDPHIAADGFTYEREDIRRWLDSGHDTSPMTNLKLGHTALAPNRALRSAILEWQQQQ